MCLLASPSLCKETRDGFLMHNIIFISHDTHYYYVFSLWEGSGQEASAHEQKKIPPITAEETSTGASEGQLINTIYAPIPPSTLIMLPDTPPSSTAVAPQPAPAPEPDGLATVDFGPAPAPEPASDPYVAPAEPAPEPDTSPPDTPAPGPVETSWPTLVSYIVQSILRFLTRVVFPSFI